MSPIQGMSNMVDGMFWDRQAITAAAANTTLPMFQLPVGVGGKTRQDTNMRGTGQLPKPEQFDVHAIRVYFETLVAADADLLGRQLTIEFSRDNRVLTEWLAFTLPSGMGVPFVSDTNGIADMRAVYTFEFPIHLDTQQPFAVNIVCGAIGAIGANTNIVVVLDGIRYLAVS